MRHEQTSTTEKSFKQTIMSQEINSTDIEMASEGELYANPEMLHYEESELNLIFSNNISFILTSDFTVSSIPDLF